MKIIKVFDAADIVDISEKIKTRQGRFEEDLQISIGVVLLNYGDPLVKVECVGEEWSGTKGELSRTGFAGVPLCPNGHPLFEISIPPRLALIEENENG